MFGASDPFLLFDQLRVPYAVEPDQDPLAPDLPDGFRWAAVRALTAAGRSVLWPISVHPARTTRLTSCQWEGIPLFVDLSASDHLARMAARDGWEPLSSLVDSTGTILASTWRLPDGSVVLPFDPNQAIRSYWTEAYRAADQSGGRSRGRALALRTYYRIRPLLPRRIQLALRRAYAPIQARTRFPRWPQEPALHDLYRALYRLAHDVAREPVPWLAAWPQPYTWAMVLTHDVETDLGYRSLPLLRAIEEAAGWRSSWNFVPRRYAVSDDLVRDLTEAGFEVGVHGLYHDGRDLASEEMLDSRLPEIRQWAERWGATGFRSPATQRRWEWMDRLGFDYDSSYGDTSPFEPQPGGCCSWLPFFIGNTVELPITLEQDHTLFVILRRPDPGAWIGKATYLRRHGGMALMITHPDYVRAEPLLGRYRAVLDAFNDDETVWRALPRDVSLWWRQRAATSLVRTKDGWRASGPAADRVSIVTGPPG